MKALIALVSVLSFILGSLSVQAASHPRTYTATINKDGTVLTQTPQWIATVEHTNQDYAVPCLPSRHCLNYEIICFDVVCTAPGRLRQRTAHGHPPSFGQP